MNLGLASFLFLVIALVGVFLMFASGDPEGRTAALAPWSVGCFLTGVVGLVIFAGVALARRHVFWVLPLTLAVIWILGVTRAWRATRGKVTGWARAQQVLLPSWSWFTRATS